MGDRIEVIDGYAWADFIPRRGDIIPVCLGKAHDVVPAGRLEAPVPEGLSGMRRAILAKAIEEVGDERNPEAGDIKRSTPQRVASRSGGRSSRHRGKTAG